MRLLRSAACALALGFSVASAAQAEDAADSRATSFQAVEGPTKEQVPGGPLLVAAYAVVLALLVAYVARLGALQKKTSSEVTRLTAAVERARKV